jgi:Flp pilus assembly pilin Flp
MKTKVANNLSDVMLSTVASIQVSLINRREAGATAVEYGLMVGLLILVIITGVAAFSGSTQRMFRTYGNTLPG